jgi:cytochrome c-type biogenesis protein CcmH
MNREDPKTAKRIKNSFALFASSRLAFLLSLLLALVAVPVHAQTPPPQSGGGEARSTSPAQASLAPAPSDDDVNRVAKQLYCPVCENIPLDVCPTPACAQWRATIREKLAQGWTDQQIRDYFAAQYGDRVLASPPPTGLNVLVWALPPLAVAAGAFILWRFVRGRQPAVIAPPLAPPSGDEYAARLEEELKKSR